MATTTNLSSLVINYLTQEQYNAAAEGGTLNENQLYLTPAEQLAAVATSGSYNDLLNKPTILVKTSITATLTVANWDNNSQTITVNGVTATNDVIVAAAPASMADYIEAEIYCSAQGSGTLTFTCGTIPSEAITVHILILE